MKRGKKLFWILWIMVLVCLPFSVSASEGIALKVNGSVVAFTEESGSPFVDENGRTQVPLRAAMEAFGAQVDWIAQTQTAVVQYGDIQVEVPIGASYIIKDGQKLENDTAALIKDGRTYLPIRKVAEAFGAQVDWDPAANMVLIEKPEQPQAENQLTVYFLDVGQADSILLQSQGQAMLIDAGTNEKGPEVVAFLQSLGISRLEYVVGTHPHEDHIGGMDLVIDAFDIGQVYLPKITANTKTFEDVLTAMAQKGLKAKAPAAGEQLSLGGAQLQFLSTGNAYQETNDCSIVIRAVHGENTFLFTADVERTAEQDIIALGYDLSAQVLKVAHHGSDTSTGEDFLEAVKPRYAVISVGAGNTYGHPASETLDKLASIGTEKIYRTDLDGTIEIESDGKKLTIATNIPMPEENGTDVAETAYIGNINSKVYHLPSCPSLPAEKNRVYFTDDLQAQQQGYRPCGVCNP